MQAHIPGTGLDVHDAQRAPEPAILKGPARVATDIPQATRETPTDTTPVAMQPLRTADTAALASNRAPGPTDIIGFFPGMKKK
ncbi:MAG TPA: hypothetical protein VL944_03350 [Candidatus Acidoferrum sp.]|nr:hypothetical protein [Candidatus Acidoferrum sp.]